MKGKGVAFLLVYLGFFGSLFAKGSDWEVISKAIKLYNRGYLLEAGDLFSKVKNKDDVSEKYRAFADYGLAFCLDRYFTAKYQGGTSDPVSAVYNGYNEQRAGQEVDGLLNEAQSLATDATLNGSMKIGEWARYKEMFHHDIALDCYERRQKAKQNPSSQETPQ